PPAMITGDLFRGVFLEEDRNAIELTFRVDEVNALMGDLERVRVLAQAVLDHGAVDALLLIAEFNDGQGGGYAHLLAVGQYGDVANMMHGSRQRLARMGTRMPILLDAQ